MDREPTDHNRELSSACLAELLQRFEDAWKRGERPQVDDYLPPEPTLRRRALVALVHTDLAYRLRGGEKIGVEDYWQRYPVLREDTPAALALIAAEYALRQPRGEASDADYLLRFPYFAEALLPFLRTTPERGTRPDAGASADATDPPLRPGDRLGPFELLALVGRGSFGVVYQARDTRLGRMVAVKILRPDGSTGSRREERFLREAQSVARLSHPGIVPLYETGQIGGVCYLVGEFVPGPTLAGFLAQGRPSIARSVELTRQIALALQHAHEQGIVHRDLKPANVLLGTAGVPRLTDFGLARTEHDVATLTGTGELLGTPAYMAPEQARGEGHQVDARADVYSLGVILYEMLTGDLPFRGAPQRVLRQVIEEEPRPPRCLNEVIPRDLETICLKALRKEPRGRYVSAAALADDLDRFLNGQPVRARPVGWAGKLGRWLRRKPLVAGLTAALVLVAIGGFTGVLAAWRQAVAEGRRAESSLTQVEQQSAEARADFRRAHQALSELLEHVLRQPTDDPDARSRALEKALDYYQRFVAQHEDDPRLAVEAAQAHLRVGDLLHALSDARACQVYARATASWQRLTELHPDEPDYRGNLIRCLLCQERDYCRKRHWDDALASGRRALALAESSAASWPADRGCRLLLASVHYNLGLLAEARHQQADGLGHYEQAQTLAEQLTREAPAVLDYLVLLGESRYKLATLLRQAGRRQEALTLYRQSVDLWTELIAFQPATLPEAGYGYWDSVFYSEAQEGLVRLRAVHSVARSYLGKSTFWAAALLDRMGRDQEALSYFRRAAETFRLLAEQMPAIASFRRDLAACYHNIGNLQRETGRLDEARKAYQEAIRLREALVREVPKDGGHRSDLDGSRRKLRLTLLLLGRLVEAQPLSAPEPPAREGKP